MQATGKVQAFDQAVRSVTLEGGAVFSVTPGADMTRVRAGDIVTLEYDDVPEPRDNPQPSDPPMRTIHMASSVVRGAPEPPSPNVLTRGSIKPSKATVNTTASLKGK